MRLERLGLAALAFRNAPGMRRAGAHIVRIALDHRRRVGDGGVARLAGLRRPVAREGPGLGGPGLVAGGEGFREPHARGRDAAGGLAGVGHHRAVPRHREPGSGRGVAGIAVGIDMGRGADLPALQGREPVGVVAGVGERQVAGRALMGGGRRGVLADGEHRGRQHGRLGQSIGECCGQERHRHRKIARHHRDVGPHRPDAGLGHQRDADIAARHRRRRRHALRGFAHGDAMQHRVERTPALQPNQPGHIGPEYRPARRGQHQQNGHREGADIEAFEDDLEQRHPGLGLTADGPVGRDGLGLGASLGIGLQGRRVAGLGGPLLAGVVDGVQHHLLAHDLARRARRADQEVVGGGQGREQLGARQRLGARAREDAASEDRAGPGDLRVPLRVQSARAGLAGDDLAGDRRRPGADRRLPCGELEHARRRGAGRRRAPGGDQGPDVGAFPQIVGRDVAEQQGVEHALPDIVAHVPREHRVGDLQAGRRGGEPGPEDQARGAGRRDRPAG